MPFACPPSPTNKDIQWLDTDLLELFLDSSRENPIQFGFILTSTAARDLSISITKFSHFIMDLLLAHANGATVHLNKDNFLLILFEWSGKVKNIDRYLKEWVSQLALRFPYSSQAPWGTPCAPPVETSLIDLLSGQPGYNGNAVEEDKNKEGNDSSKCPQRASSSSSSGSDSSCSCSGSSCYCSSSSSSSSSSPSPTPSTEASASVFNDLDDYANRCFHDTVKLYVERKGLDGELVSRVTVGHSIASALRSIYPNLIKLAVASARGAHVDVDIKSIAKTFVEIRRDLIQLETMLVAPYEKVVKSNRKAQDSEGLPGSSTYQQMDDSSRGNYGKTSEQRPYNKSIVEPGPIRDKESARPLTGSKESSVSPQHCERNAVFKRPACKVSSRDNSRCALAQRGKDEEEEKRGRDGLPTGSRKRRGCSFDSQHCGGEPEGKRPTCKTLSDIYYEETSKKQSSTCSGEKGKKEEKRERVRLQACSRKQKRPSASTKDCNAAGSASSRGRYQKTAAQQARKCFGNLEGRQKREGATSSAPDSESDRSSTSSEESDESPERRRRDDCASSSKDSKNTSEQQTQKCHGEDGEKKGDNSGTSGSRKRRLSSATTGVVEGDEKASNSEKPSARQKHRITAKRKS